MSEKQSRKSFLKKIGLSLSAATVAPFVSATGSEYLKDGSLNDEQKAFLSTYEMWLSEFHGFVKKQKEDITSLENNKKLMELSAQAAEWKRQLEVHMMDEQFAKYHTRITNAITDDIA